VTERAAADRVHAALKASHTALFGQIVGARLDQREGYLLLVCPPLPIAELNGVWADDPGDEQSAVNQLGEAIAEVEALGLPCSVQVRAGLMPALEAEAKRLGFESEELVPAMVAMADDLRGRGRTQLQIAQIDGAESLEEAHGLAAAGFEAPADMLAPFFTSKVAAMPGLSIYVARAEGKPVSTATSLVQGDAVGIFNVATPPQHRRSGYASALTIRAAIDGLESGATFAWLQSTPASASVYRRIGFRQVDTYTLLSRP
jgi:Acetyltransferase (GNAT) domain